MKAIVCGSRNYPHRSHVYRVLDRYVKERGLNHIVVGGMTGVDSHAEKWARTFHVPVTVITAAWEKYGKVAGPMRNQRLAEQRPDLVIAFPGGNGTQSMVMIATECGIPIETIPIEEPVA